MEKKEEKKLSFGRLLATVRYEKGLELDHISKQIKVNYKVLQDIENEDHSKLPNETFIKGFVKSYAEVLGIDSREIVDLYNRSHAHYQHALEADKALESYTSKFWNRILSAFFMIIVMIFFSVYLMPVEKRDIGNSDSSVTAPSADIPEKPKIATGTEEITGSVTAPHLNGAEKSVKSNVEVVEKQQRVETLHLKIKAIEETWIKIVIDKQKPMEFTLKPGDETELEGKETFNLLVGNAGGIKLYLNDKPVDIIGKSGQIATVVLPK